MIIFKEKIFNSRVRIAFEKLFGISSAAEYFNNQDKFERFPLELMKMLEMHSYKDGALLSHWSEKTLEHLDQVQKFHRISSVLSAYTVNSFDDLRGIIGENEIITLVDRYGTPDNMIDSIRYRMLHERSSKFGGPKYDTMWFAKNKPVVSNDVFRDVIKFIALCSTGQIDPNSFIDFWDRSFQNIIHTDKINTKLPTHKISTQTIQYLIICAISGYSGVDYTGLI